MDNKTMQHFANSEYLNARRTTALQLISLIIAIIVCTFSFEYAFLGWGSFVWISSILLGFSLLRRSAKASAFQLAFFSGCSWLIIARWLPIGINSMNPSYPILGYGTLLVLAILSSVPYLFAGWIIGKRGWLSNNPRPLSAAALISLFVELWPARLPGSLSNPLYQHISMIQIVDFGGTGFLSFIVYAVGFLLVTLLFLVKTSAERVTAFFVILFMICAPLFYGVTQSAYWRQYIESTEHLRIGMIQPNLPIENFETPNSRENSLDTLSKQTHELIQKNQDLDLVVWPEIPVFFSPRNSQSAEGRLRMILEDSAVPLLANADSYPNDQLYGRVPFYNTVQLFKGGGTILQEYQKMILVPFGEYLPFEEWLTAPSLQEFLRDVRRYVPGDKVNLIELKGKVKLGTPICLEAHHTSLISAMVGLGANVLINPANDAYFGVSNGSKVDFALTVFRAVEYRVPLVRVTNSGISAAVNQVGEVLQDTLLPEFTATSQIVSVAPSSSPGFFTPKEVGMFLMFLTIFVGSLDKRASRRRI